jgi:succinate dehydrogenase hydrophobic anchor subunit
MKLTQLERVKSELKQTRYELYKISGLILILKILFFIILLHFNHFLDYGHYFSKARGV